MFSSNIGKKIEALYSGDIAPYSGDDSSADMALCNHLAFWTDRNVEQMDRMWLASPLGQRKKTQERKDYRTRTIAASIAGCHETYDAYRATSKTTAKSQENEVKQYEDLLDAVPKDTAKAKLITALKPLFEALADEVSLAEAEIYIRDTVKKRFMLTVKDVDSFIKHFKQMRKPIAAKKEAARASAEQAAAEPAPTEEERQIAERVLRSPTLLYEVLKMVKKLGIVGEEKNILLHYIVVTSRNLSQPLSAVVKGDSSSGKSHVLLTTLKLFPKSAYIDLTDATPQSFYYTPDGYFKHKIIVLFEKHGSERADYSIRTLQSEGKLKIQVTVKNPDTGEFEAKVIEKEGPTGFVTTTTASLIHGENDTRNISIFPDQSSAQTSRVYASVDAKYLGKPKVSDSELKPWHHAQVILEPLPVLIPFAASFRKYFPATIVRTRRDYGHFLAIMETIALLHQKQRSIIEINGQKHIRATLADAYMAKVIVEASLAKTIYELPEKTIEVILAAKSLFGTDPAGDLPPLDDSKGCTFTITQLSKGLGWDRDTVAKWLKPAEKKGYVTVVVESKGSKGAEYKVEEKELPSDEFLPTVEQLVADNPTEIIGGMYDPLTGEQKDIEKVEEVCTDAPMHEEAR
jgi:hypothetical protein